VIDSHAHLTMFDSRELPAVLERATAAGITDILVPATSPEDLGAVASLRMDSPIRVHKALGIHPHEARHLDDALKARLERLLGGSDVVAVGEIGLDYHYDLSPREEQRAAFRWQLALARERGLPVVLHHREAWDDFLSILDEHPGLPGVAHSFTEGTGGATAMMGRGLLIGISGMATFPRGDNIRDAARTALPARLLVETDAPYLAPVPHRGKRNEPAFVRLVAETVAQVRGVALADFERETDTAFRSLFLQGQ